MSLLEKLHKAYMDSKEPEENYNYDDNTKVIKDNEFTSLPNDEDFKKHINKLKWMKEFNSGRGNR